MEKKPYRILVVDDEQDLLEILSFNLESWGYDVQCVTSAIDALALPLGQFDLFLLDVMMSGMSGFKLAEVLRKDRHLDTPIIFLTAKDTEADILTGFHLGADDYIAKPFSIKEVQARVNAVLARNKASSSSEESPDTLQLANMKIDMERKTVFIDGETITLTKKELEILCLLASQPDRVFAREEILAKVWRGESYVLERTVDVHIARLRKKVQAAHIQIVNRSGFGYCLQIL